MSSKQPHGPAPDGFLVRNLITVSVSVAAVVILAVGATLTWQAAAAYASADRLHQANTAVDELLAAAAYQARERGLTAAALRSENGSAVYDELLSLRERGDGHWRNAMARIDALRDGSATPALLEANAERARAAWQWLGTARRHADRTILTGGTPLAADEWLATVTDLIAANAALRDQLLVSMEIPLDIAHLNLNVKRLVWQISENAGQVRGILSYYAAAGEPIPDFLMEQIYANQMAIRRGTDELMMLAGPQDGVDPRLLEAMITMEERLRREAFPAARAMLAAAATGDYPMEAREWFDHATRGIDTVLAVSDVVSEVTRERIDQRVRQASMIVAAYAAFTLVAGLLALASLSSVRRNTLALASQRQARREAEETTRIKSEFLATVSHDLRTPLNAIIGFMELLRDAKLSGEQRRYLELSRTAGENLIALIDTLLDLSRIEAGGAELQCRPFDLQQLLGDQLDLLRIQADEKGLHLELTWDDDVPRWVCGDPARLWQIIGNLIGNGLKFTERGGVHLHVARGEGDRLVFAVKDTGIGIPKEEQESIFNAFSQGNGIARRYGGSGLGLKICREFARLMEGEVWVESRPGEHTTFYLAAVLPETEAAAPEAAGHVRSAFETPLPQLPDAAPADDATLPGQGLTVLVAEDEPVNTLLIRTMLEQAGCRVETVDTGRKAVQEAARQPYDLILMDVQMPEMTGDEATREIRRMESERGRPHTPIIALSAHAVESIQQNCLEAGCDAYLTKPVQPAALHGLLTWTRNRRAAHI